VFIHNVAGPQQEWMSLFTYIHCVAYYNNRDLSQLDTQAVEVLH